MGLDEINNRIVVTTGQLQNGGVINDVWEFNLNTETWKEIIVGNPKPSIRYGSSGGIVMNGIDKGQYLYISHGFSNSGRSQDTFRFNLVTNQFEDITPTSTKPINRCLQAGVVTSNKTSYMFGGCASGFGACPLNDLWVFDGTSWAQLSNTNAPSARQFPTMAPLYDGKGVCTDLIVYGGSSGGNEIYKYNIVGNSWTKVLDTAPNYQGVASAVQTNSSGTVIYFLGGNQDLYIFDLKSSTPQQSQSGIICFGKQSTDPLVCSGKGKCIGNNQCQCNAGWSGSDCEKAPPGTVHCKDFSTGHKLRWTLGTSTISFNLTISNSIGISQKGWAAIGFNSITNTMIGASIIMAYGNNINEYKAIAFQKPDILQSPRITAASASQSFSGYVLQFTRPYNVTNDASYFALKDENQRVLVVYNDQATPTGPTSFSKHTNTEIMTINLFRFSECSNSSMITISMLIVMLSVVFSLIY